MPYTLWGQYSLKNFNNIKDSLKDHTDLAYIKGKKEQRTGPSAGNCCASFVSEVFGVLQSNGNPKYCNCGELKSNASSFGATYIPDIKFKDIKAGDALFMEGHVIWVYDINHDNNTITIYESSYPVARSDGTFKAKTKNGYFSYNGTYTEAIRLNIFNSH
jgi:surface antigen